MIRLFFLLIVSLFFNGCNSLEEEPTEKFRMNLHSEPHALDPRLVRDIPMMTTSKMFFDGLTRPSLDGTILLSVAEQMEVSEDKTHYEFTLRDSSWSNGMPLVAADFEYAWKSVLSPNFPAEFAHQLFVLKNGKKAKLGGCDASQIGVRAVGKNKLIVDLEYPDPYFLELLSFPICYPICKSIAEKNEAWSQCQGREFICNGPFRLVQWNHGSELTAEKNPLYWDYSAVKLDQIILTMIEDEHTELNMYENDELDWAGSPNSSIPPEAIPTLKCKNEMYILPIAGTFCYKFNTLQPPFNCIKMRRAFALAIHRKSLVEDILQANQLVARALLPPCLQAKISHEGYFIDDDRVAALELFEESLRDNGWTRESLPAVTLIFSKSEKHQKVAQAVQQQWCNTFGIKVALQSYEWNSYLDHLARGNFQVGGKGWISDLSDPKTLLELYQDDDNETGWHNAEFAALVESAKYTTDEKERLELLQRAESILLKEMPVAPLYHSTACFLKKTYVRDVYLSKLCDIDLKHAYIQR